MFEEGVAGDPVPQHMGLGLFIDQRRLGPENELEHGDGEAAVVAAPWVLMLLVQVDFFVLNLIIIIHRPEEQLA